MKNLFKPFFTTQDIGVGTGLGFVQGWGGSIPFERRENEGMAFRIQLPRS